MRTGILVFLFFLVACSSSVPGGILPPIKMQGVIYDLMQTDEYLATLGDSSLDKKKQRSINYEQVFNLHHTTRKEFYTSYQYYQQHPDVNQALFDSLTNFIERESKEPIRHKPITSSKK